MSAIIMVCLIALVYSFCQSAAAGVAFYFPYLFSIWRITIPNGWKR
ncbi:hypothetical protein [Uruburuella suis]|jgi:hypothetical protein|nr:hypothetical protein [Uruburuella suis]